MPKHGGPGSVGEKPKDLKLAIKETNVIYA
jgi:hypothetical protein